MSRILDLEYEVDDGQMVVTIFQYSSYFLSQGRYACAPCDLTSVSCDLSFIHSKGVPKCLRELAEECRFIMI